jgi:adenylylsulfate kinase
VQSDIKWQNTKITRSNHEELQGYRSICIWFTGLSGAGKSTIANAVQQRLFQRKIRTYLLDGDNVRHGLNGDLGFSKEDRQENVRRVAEVAHLFVEAGVTAIAALISPFERDRQMARSIFEQEDFVEIFVNCPIDICIERDPKGLYKKAQVGIIRDFTGISSPYDPPESPELIINTSQYSIDECVDQVMRYLHAKLGLAKVTT